MDVIVDLLVKYKFCRVVSKLELPIIIHCVPGAGKSTLIRELIRGDSRFVAFTAGIGDQPHVSGRIIKKWQGELCEDKLNVLDEYTLLTELPSGLFACFGDPLQTESHLCLSAHFTSNLSHRFGPATAQLLRDFDFEIEADGEDVVQIKGIYDFEPTGVVLYHECEVGELLRRHNLEAKHYTEVFGQTFEKVTFVTGQNGIGSNRVATFQCLTRHRKALIILCPDATYAPS